MDTKDKGQDARCGYTLRVGPIETPQPPRMLRTRRGLLRAMPRDPNRRNAIPEK
ncbi:hypothetical protein GCM10011396_38020 [Undibacterium terreum]|uniref:Uncharacterized protein n=1 Tax=Undibacterium terreum TaxID=1224302 RepID=A0A916UUC3_9BURK|nr:hypothetical protein GCM10011396_38020 [Undibacterium terreum]